MILLLKVLEATKQSLLAFYHFCCQVTMTVSLEGSQHVGKPLQTMTKRTLALRTSLYLVCLIMRAD